MNKKTIKEICLKLGLKIEIIHDVFIYYELFSNSKTHKYSNEIMVASSIFASTKIQEDPKRIRDIINVIYLVMNKYKILHKTNDEKDHDFIDLLHKDDFSSNETLIKTMHNISLANYRLHKEEVLSAEQHLLRISSFSFKKMSKEVLIDLISLCEKIDFNSNQMQLSWDILLFVYEEFSAYEINTASDLIICVILKIVIDVYYSLNDNDNEKVKVKNEEYQRQNDIYNKIKQDFKFEESKYESYLNVILNNYFKSDQKQQV